MSTHERPPAVQQRAVAASESLREALLREERLPAAAGRPREEGSLGARPREAPRGCSPGVEEVVVGYSRGVPVV